MSRLRSFLILRLVHIRGRENNNNRKYTHHHYIIPLNFQNLRTLFRAFQDIPGLFRSRETFSAARFRPVYDSGNIPLTRRGTGDTFPPGKTAICRIYDPDEINLIVFGRFASIVEIVTPSPRTSFISFAFADLICFINFSFSIPPGIPTTFLYPGPLSCGSPFASQTASC